MYSKESYIIKKLRKGDFSCIVFTYGDSRVDEILNEIEKSLISQNLKGKIAFDLLLMNGLKDRFYSADFNGKKFNLSSFQALSSPAVLCGTSNEYLAQNLNIIYNSNLSNTKKFLFRKAVTQ